jgi:hypothetical protein
MKLGATTTTAMEGNVFSFTGYRKYFISAT